MACSLSQVKFTITTPDPLLLVMYHWKAVDIQVITRSRYSVMGIILFIAIINIIIASVMVTIIIIVIFIDKHCLNYSLKP